MKNTFIIIFLFLINQLCTAQWTESDIKPYLQKADKKIKAFVAKKVQSGEWDEEYDSIEIEFVTDTMRIEETARLIGDDGHYSTMDMHNTLSYQMAEYDKLLNKYYKILIGRLSEEDKARLKEAQRGWLKYRDSEDKINREVIAPNNYTGGGTMWPIIAKGRTLQIIKDRVCSLYEFFTYV